MLGKGESSNLTKNWHPRAGATMERNGVWWLFRKYAATLVITVGGGEGRGTNVSFNLYFLKEMEF